MKVAKRMRAQDELEYRPAVRRSAPPGGMTELQVRAIEIFVAAAHALRLPRPAGEIYGLLFVTMMPVSLDHILNTLQMSRATVGQALRQLRAIGAVKRVYVLGDRSNCYLAEMELWSLATGILRDRIAPRIARSDEVLADLEHLITTGPPSETAGMLERLELLRCWNSQVSQFIPLLIDHLASPPHPAPAAAVLPPSRL